MLTERQTDIVKRLAVGVHTKGIADELGLSHKTVQFHLTKARRKLGVNSTIEMVHFAIARLGVPLLFCLLATCARAGSVQLQWDRSTTTNATYVLYGTTNATLVETNLNQAQVIADVGTNLTVLALTTPAAVGTWKFAVTAKVGAVQSAPSNLLTLVVPSAPTNLVTVMVQYSGVLEGLGTSPTNLFLTLKPVP